MLKALISNKEKLLELGNTPLNENYSAVIHKKLSEKLAHTGKFLILCGFSELKCKALADLEDLKGTRIEHGFKRAFMSLFGQDHDTFTSTMFLNVDQLQKQLDKDDFQEDGSIEAFWVINRQFQKFIDSQFSLDYDRQYDRRVNKRQMQTRESKIDTGKAVDDDLVVTKSSGTESEVHDDNNMSGNDTNADDGDIRPIYDEEKMVEEKVFAIAALKNELRKLKGNSVDTNHSTLLPKKSESAFAKPDHMIASSSSRNSFKNMSRFSSNDMVHNHYLDEAKKKTQERDRNSKTSVMTSARFQSTADDSKPKPRSTNHSSRSLPISKSSYVTITAMPKANHSKSPSSFSDPTCFFYSTCNKCVFIAIHDACITKLLKEVNSRTKIQSHKTRDRSKPVDQKSHTQIPGRQIFTGHTFLPIRLPLCMRNIS
nr:reverse transcriptase domain-containing protein [Tanacetum cinerariifolium]